MSPFRAVICCLTLVVLCTAALGAEKQYQTLYRQGVAANKAGNFVEAIGYYSKAIAQKSDSADLYFVRGRAYRQNSQYDEAIGDFTKAIALKPGHAEAYNQRGVTYIGKGKKEQALADFTKACSLSLKDGCANAQKLKGAK